MARFIICSSLSKIFFLHHIILMITMSQGHAQQASTTGFSLKMIPWDSPNSPLYHPNLTQTQKIQIMAMSSTTSAAKPNIASNNATHLHSIRSTGAVPLTNQHLRYSVAIKFGSPGTEIKLLLDTGSGPIWTRCADSKSIFNPLKSSSYRSLPCDHPLCKTANNICKCIQGKCICTIKYGTSWTDIYQISAVLSSDSITLPLKKRGGFKTYTNMIFGCSRMYPILSGIVGLNRSPVSLISQLKNSARGRYSYCLHNGDGYLRFGDDIPQVGKNAKTSPILYPRKQTMFLNLKDISVAKKRLRLSPTYFSYEQGGFSIDTGTTLTTLRKKAYDKVINAFTKYYKTLKRVDGKPYLLDLCYKSRSNFRSNVSMTFHLEGADYETRNLFVTPKTGVVCLGLVPGDVTMLGALQQRDTRFIFDINTNKLTFLPEDCSKDGAS